MTTAYIDGEINEKAKALKEKGIYYFEHNDQIIVVSAEYPRLVEYTPQLTISTNIAHIVPTFKYILESDISSKPYMSRSIISLINPKYLDHIGPLNLMSLQTRYANSGV